MKPATTKTLYWGTTAFFCLLMIMDGSAGLAREATGQEVMHQLGLPVYIMQITGLAKVLGAVALLQTRFKTLKEWAFAGFAINFFGAMACWYMAGYGAFNVLFPLVGLALLAVPYYFWKRYLALQAAGKPDYAGRLQVA